VKKARIKVGAKIMHDFQTFRWPECKPPRCCPEVDPDMVFDVRQVQNGNLLYWECSADGYGYLKSRGDNGEYGNGSIAVLSELGIELID